MSVSEDPKQISPSCVLVCAVLKLPTRTGCSRRRKAGSTDSCFFYYYSPGNDPHFVRQYVLPGTVRTCAVPVRVLTYQQYRMYELRVPTVFTRRLPHTHSSTSAGLSHRVVYQLYLSNFATGSSSRVFSTGTSL